MADTSQNFVVAVNDASQQLAAMIAEHQKQLSNIHGAIIMMRLHDIHRPTNPPAGQNERDLFAEWHRAEWAHAQPPPVLARMILDEPARVEPIPERQRSTERMRVLARLMVAETALAAALTNPDQQALEPTNANYLEALNAWLLINGHAAM